MDETALQRVVNFSTYLKSFADVLLDKSGGISIDTWTLYEIEEAFSLIFEVEKYTNFHVLPPNNRQHPAIPHIQFLYDILQKVKKLRILSKPCQVLPQEQRINLKCFRNLSSLELEFIPVSQLKGLQNLRPVLKSLTVKGVCSQIGEILSKCGADKSTEYEWENLEFGSFSRNKLHNLDSSLRLLPAIKILDLSYCELRDASAVFCLPTVVNLDLSYNKLPYIPALSENASNTLLSLNLSNNMIIDIKGVERFSNLEELNLKENFLSIDHTLVHLIDLPHLRYLNLLRNPITCGLNYRMHVLHCLNPATKFCEHFLFDDYPLVYNERQEIGRTTLPSPSGSSSTNLIKFLTEKVSNLLRPPSLEGQKVSPAFYLSDEEEASAVITQAKPDTATLSKSFTSKLSGKERRKSRKNQTRHISINDPDDSLQYTSIRTGTSATSNNALMSSSLTEKSSGAATVIEARVIAETSEATTSPPHAQNNPQGDTKLGTLTGAPSQSDRLLEEILSSHTGLQNSGDVSDDVTTNLPLEGTPEGPEANTTSQDTRFLSSGSASSFCRMQEPEVLPSRDFSPVHTDDEDLEPHRELYSVVAKWEHKLIEKSVDIEADFVFLSFTSYFYKEKNGLTGATMVKLNISSLQGMEVLATQPYKVALHFNHPHPDLCSRVLNFEEDDFKLLQELVSPIIERNQREEHAPPPPPCKECGLPFYGTLASFAGDTERNQKYCKYCGNRRKASTNSRWEIGNKAIQSSSNGNTLGTKVFASSNGSELKANSITSSKDRVHKRQRSSAQSSDSSESVSVCSSDVSSGYPKQTSDLDRLSSPSLSSIEVLPEKHPPEVDESSYDRWGEARMELPVSAALNSDARTPPVNSFESRTVTVEEEHKEEVTTPTKEPTLMQESSSSGSMTGSVCTAVDRLSLGPSTPLKGKKETFTGSLERFDISNSISTSNHTDVSAVADDNTYLSTSAKSTDTVCHHPASSLREAFATLHEFDSDKGGLVLEEPTDNSSLRPWAEKLVHCYTCYCPEWWSDELVNENECPSGREPNGVSFHFDDISVVDHRLKLYCEVFLFTEPQETLYGLVKTIATVDCGEPFSSLLVISNRKVYILRIKGSQSDVPQDWLETETTCFLEHVPVIYTLFQKPGLVLLLNEKVVLISFADTQRTNAVLFFILECLEQFGIHPEMDDSCSHQQSECLRRQLLQMEDISSDTNIHLFQMVTLLHENGECSNNFLVMTSSHVILFEADLKWLVPAASQEIEPTNDVNLQTSRDLVLTSCHPIDDVTQIDMFSDTHLKLNFYQHRPSAAKSPWELHVASSWVGCNLVQTLRPLWGDLLKVDLDVVCYSEDLLIVREILKHTPFADYIKDR